MKKTLSEKLRSASKEELIDIIEERLHLDSVFRKTLEYRFAAGESKDVSELMDSFRRQVDEEVDKRYPDTSVIRSARFALEKAMDSWSVYDYCVGCVAIIRAFADALCRGAGMDDDSDFELSMDMEDASNLAVEKLKGCSLNDEDRGRIRTMLLKEMDRPLDVGSGKELFGSILKAL